MITFLMFAIDKYFNLDASGWLYVLPVILDVAIIEFVQDYRKER